MTKPRAKQPLSSFDPRMMQLLIKGSRTRIVLPFIGEDKKKLAHNFHRRMHTLRARMRDENHEHSAVVAKALVRILWGRKVVEEGLLKPDTSEEIKAEWIKDVNGRHGAFIVIQPRDSEFAEVLDPLFSSDLPEHKPQPDTTPLEEEPIIVPRNPVDEAEDLEDFLNSLTANAEVEK